MQSIPGSGGWRKNYRVWEANRKVSLYPENWIAPELRDNKTPYFMELEAELMQNDVTNDSAEKALMGYCAKLDEVARLEVCAMYLEEFPVPGRSILHVVARTLTGAPRRYFYRQLVDDSIWTPWDRLKLDIQGTEGPDSSGVQLLPVVWNRLLSLFWLMFARKADPVTSTSETGGGLTAAAPKEYWEIKLAWSLYEDGRWAQKRVSNVAVEFPQKF